MNNNGISERIKRISLALAFGIVLQGSFITGIPGGVPGLGRAVSCTSCTMKLNKGGIPSEFAPYMTDEQKKKFKEVIKKG